MPARMLIALAPLIAALGCTGEVTTTTSTQRADALTFVDTDGDGTPDGVDYDDDGVVDFTIPAVCTAPTVDSDGDGTPDAIDTDCDGTGDVALGIPSGVPGGACIPEALDTDGDSLPDGLDLDCDGVVDTSLSGGTPPICVPALIDADADGLPEGIDTDCDGTADFSF